MSKFILVHDASDNASTTIINVDTIEYVERSTDYTGASFICTSALDIHVTETREQIFEMLK